LESAQMPIGPTLGAMSGARGLINFNAAAWCDPQGRKVPIDKWRAVPAVPTNRGLRIEPERFTTGTTGVVLARCQKLSGRKRLPRPARWNHTLLYSGSGGGCPEGRGLVMLP